MSFLQSDLDVLLLLESQYNTSSLLLALQKSNRSILANYDYSNNDEIINNDEQNESESEVQIPKYLEYLQNSFFFIIFRNEIYFNNIY